MWASKLAYMDLGLGLLGQTKPVITACVVCWQHPEVSYSVTVASKDLYTMLVNPSLLSVKRIGFLTVHRRMPQVPVRYSLQRQTGSSAVLRLYSKASSHQPSRLAWGNEEHKITSR